MTDKEKLARLKTLTQDLNELAEKTWVLAAERKQLIEDLHEKYSFRQLAAELGISETRVWQIVHRVDPPPRLTAPELTAYVSPLPLADHKNEPVRLTKHNRLRIPVMRIVSTKKPPAYHRGFITASHGPYFHTWTTFTSSSC